MSIFDMKNLPQESEEIENKPLVMLVDDEIENINVLRQLLESRFKIITGLNGAEALELIDNMVDPTTIQLIISDQRMPKVTGVEFLEKIVDRMPDTIRIILTGYSDIQVIIDSINKAKLYKFMTKPFDPVELSLTVQRGVEAYQMRKKLLEYTKNLEHLVAERTEDLNTKNEALVQSLDNLEKMSLSDQLTGACNRHFLKKFLPQEVAKFQREKKLETSTAQGFGIIMLDIDYFKHVNDTYGHDAGDKVLVQFTKILKEICRESDWLVRWGGEEFVIIARDLSLEGLEQLAERIRVNVASYQFDLGCEQYIFRTCSIGLASFPFINHKFEALTWQETLNFADLALYVAKNNGRNTWVSLFDNDVSYEESFYESMMTNLADLISQNIIGYHISGSKESIEF
jgi:two-component system cell cycle response regulator